MALRRRWALALGAGWALGIRAQTARPLVLLVDSATEMPMARLQGDRVVGGMTLELAELLASRLGRTVQGVARPRRRLLQTLTQGEADFVCTYMAEWLPGPLQWSEGFFEQDEVIISRIDVAAPRRLADLAGQRIGTVLGFVYPELDAALGAGFLREDAPSAEANLRKLAAARVRHAVVNLRLLDYLRREGRFTAAVHPPLLLRRLHTQCALRPGAAIGLAQLNSAIDQVKRDGSLRALYRRYAVEPPALVP